MPKWKLFGVVVVLYHTDHPPRHVHVYQDGKRVLKFDVETWMVMEGALTPKAKRALAALRERGAL